MFMNLIDCGIENKLIELINEKNQIKYISQNKNINIQIQRKKFSQNITLN